MTTHPIALFIVLDFEDKVSSGDHEGDDVGNEGGIAQGDQRVGILTLEDVGTEHRRQIVGVHLVFCRWR